MRIISPSSKCSRNRTRRTTASCRSTSRSARRSATYIPAGVFLDTDIGFGVRGGLQRRWLNASGHKLKVEVQVAQKLKTASVVYSIPLPGPNNRSYNFGVDYLNENTDTTISHTRIAGRQRDAAMDGLHAHARSASAHRHVRHPRSARQQGAGGTRQHDAAVSGTRARTKTRRRSAVRARRLFAHAHRARRTATDLRDRLRCKCAPTANTSAASARTSA